MDSEKYFDFFIEGEYSFEVLSFKGREELGRCYYFKLELLGPQGLDPGSLLQQRAAFSLIRDLKDSVFHGLISSMELIQAIGEMALYTCVLVPALWRLGQTRHNQAFTDKSAPQFLQEVLLDGGLLPGQFRFELARDYEPREYVCQYGESHLEFFERWLAKEGMYYYFDQPERGEMDSGEVVVITDTRISHTAWEHGTPLRYAPPSGLNIDFGQEYVQQFGIKYRQVSGRVMVKDYNYRRPDLNLEFDLEVDEDSSGLQYFYGDHYYSPEQGREQARIHAQNLENRRLGGHGYSTARSLRCGYLFDLHNYFILLYNGYYLATRVEHEGHQTSYLSAGLGLKLGGRELLAFYRNTFSVIPAHTQFRLEKNISGPRFSGVLNGWIKAEGGGEYARPDEQGRYRVVLPFDGQGRGGSRASAWVRLSQPYAGIDHGLHFPLHDNTEVLLGFVQGNPDRPVILGAVPNPGTPSVVDEKTCSSVRLTTGGDNRIYIEDRQGSQRFLFYSPHQNSWLRIGAHNDPLGYFKPDKDNSGIGKNGFLLNTKGSLGFIIGLNWNIQVLGNSLSIIGGGNESVILGFNNTSVLLEYLQFLFGFTHKIYKERLEGHWEQTKIESGVDFVIAETRNKAGELETKIAEARQKLQQVNTKIGEVHNSLTQEQVRLRQMSNVLTQARTRLRDTETELTQTRTVMEQVGTRMTQVDSSLSQTRNTLRQADICMTQATTLISEEETALRASDLSITSMNSLITELETLI